MKIIYLPAISILFLSNSLLSMDDSGRPAKKQKTEQKTTPINIQLKPDRSKEEQKFLNLLSYYDKNFRKLTELSLVTRQILSEPIAPFFQNLAEKFYPIELSLDLFKKDMGINLGSTRVVAMDIDPSGRYLAYAKHNSPDFMMTIISGDKAGTYNKVFDVKRMVYIIRWSQDGNLLLAGDDHGNLYAYDARDKENITLINSSRIFAPNLMAINRPIFQITISPDNNYIFCVGWNADIVLIDFSDKKTFNIVANLRGKHQGSNIKSISFNYNSTQAISSDEKNIYIWDLSNKANINNIMNPSLRLPVSDSRAVFSDFKDLIFYIQNGHPFMYKLNTPAAVMIKSKGIASSGRFILNDNYIFSLGKQADVSTFSFYDIRNPKFLQEVLALKYQNQALWVRPVKDGKKLIFVDNNNNLKELDTEPLLNLDKKIHNLTSGTGTFKIYLLIEEIIKFHQSFTTGKRPFVIKHPDIKKLFMSENFPLVLRQAMLDKKYVELQ